MNNAGLIVAAIVATIGMMKFKLIEELIKKMTQDNQKSRIYSVILLFSTVVILAAISMSLEQSPKSPSQPSPEPTPVKEAIVKTEPLPAAPSQQQVLQKSELEVKVAAVKDGITLADQFVRQAKENKRVKDSVFIANRQERWVYRIGDWTKDDGKIFETYKQLSVTENIKVLRHGKKYLLIREDFQSRDVLHSSLDSVRTGLGGMSVSLVDINTFLKRRKDQFAVEVERFGGRRENKGVDLDCLKAD